MNYEADSNQVPDPTLPSSATAWTEQTHRFDVIQEQVQVDKQVIETGVVHITKRVSEDRQIVNLPSSREEITVERIARNQYVETPPSVRYEGDTMIIPVLQEVIVTQKKILLVEEVYVTRHQVHEHQSQEVVLRKEAIIIERTPITPDKQPE